jgi:hypothetical protein
MVALVSPQISTRTRRECDLPRRHFQAIVATEDIDTSLPTEAAPIRSRHAVRFDEILAVLSDTPDYPFFLIVDELKNNAHRLTAIPLRRAAPSWRPRWIMS